MNEFTYFDYDESDYAMLCRWAEEHDAVAPPEDFLPEFGFIICYQAEPFAFVFLYHDISCRVAFLDLVHTKKGTALGILKGGIVYLMEEPVREIAAARDFHTVLTRSPAAMARVMMSTPRWHIHGEELKSMAYVYTPKELVFP
jgi:hypothetical protein